MQTLVSFLVEFRDLMSNHALFTLGMLLIIGYFTGKLASLFRLPEITGFIVAGLIMGETVTGIVPHHMGENLKIVTEVALGLIALTIGGEFYWVKLKRVGKEVVIITIVQLLASFGAVVFGMTLLGFDLPYALMLGAIASATAPAATVAIVQSLRATGLFVDYLYGVVALDDAGAVILFGLSFAMASGLLGVSGADHGAVLVIVHALGEVLLSLAAGAVAGFLIHRFTRKKSSNEIMIITLGFVFLATAVSVIFELSPLMTNMAAGAVIINLSPSNHRIFRILEPLTPPIYALFFVIAGTELQPAILIQTKILLLGGGYILFRALGKYSGVYFGSLLGKVRGTIRTYLGFCMLPQAGVAIGLVLMIQASPLVSYLPPEQIVIIDTMVNIILLSVFINELIGPPISKYALIRGNEMEA
ncbi:cation:proton antiporter [Marispirochaeta aestuarii]|uniref:cation:proton antiporter n=1 Tax=Marispirochaeta aestuarii TaxID=1963862 RepID=UPI0029C65416|nr:cation:proton antiporter [Marispirochaeta aestuarii]